MLYAYVSPMYYVMGHDPGKYTYWLYFPGMVITAVCQHVSTHVSAILLLYVCVMDGSLSVQRVSIHLSAILLLCVCDGLIPVCPPVCGALDNGCVYWRWAGNARLWGWRWSLGWTRSSRRTLGTSPAPGPTQTDGRTDPTQRDGRTGQRL